MSKTDLMNANYFDFLEDLHLEALEYIDKIIKRNKDEIYINNYDVQNNGSYMDYYKVN